MSWDPDTYLPGMLEEIPAYAEFQDRVAAATADVRATTALELGVGTGETTRRVLDYHPSLRLTGIDSSDAMLARARETYPEADLRLSRLEDPLPVGPFELVFSALAVHHLDAASKRDLFRRVAEVMAPGASFVLGDVVVPEREEDMQIPIDWELDLPDRVDDQLDWLRDAGLEAEPVWTFKDLAVIVGTR